RLSAGTTDTVLLLSVTAVSGGRPVFIDSYRAAFEHIVVSDAVRASIGFPFAFTPKSVTYIRELATERQPATREALQRGVSRDDINKLRADSKLEVARDHFIDGGVTANFPIWAVARYLRQTLYGHTSGIEPETVRVARPRDASRREKFTDDGEVLCHRLL